MSNQTAPFSVFPIFAPDAKVINGVVNPLWTDYPNGFYAHPGNHKKVSTKHYQGLIEYLTKYLSSPPIGVSRIVDYDGESVKYYYQSHRTKVVEYETIDAQTFIGRWYDVIVGVTGDLVDAMFSDVKRIDYAAFFGEVAKRNPLKCRFCGSVMELVRLFHPDRGLFFDLLAPPDG